MESTSYVFPFRVVFFYLVTTGSIFDISLLCEDSINQSINNLTSKINHQPVVQGRKEGIISQRVSSSFSSFFVLFSLFSRPGGADCFPVQQTTSGIGYCAKKTRERLFAVHGLSERTTVQTSSLLLRLFLFNNTINTSVIKHALVPNGWVAGWLGGVVVGGWVVWWWVVVVVGGRRQRCIIPSGW